jgi:uncharacterized damage-inducible protein DinB
MLDAQLVDSWNINNRINLYLLDAVPIEVLPSVPVGMKGRSVAEIFAHLHNVRLMWLENAAPERMVANLPIKSKADKDGLTADALRFALTASGEQMAALFEQGAAAGKIRNVSPHVVDFFSYLISHEGYHRGEICMTLTLAGHKLPDEVLYGLWDWSKFRA